MNSYLELYDKNIKYIKNDKKENISSSKNCKIENRNDEILIICDQSKEWTTKIIKSISINLNEKNYENKMEINKLLSQISILLNADTLSKEKFNHLKEKYIAMNEENIEIEKIFTIQKDEIEKIKKDIFNINFTLGQIYYEKKELFDKIRSFYNFNVVNDLKTVYLQSKKENENVNKGVLVNIAKKHEIPIDNIHLIIQYIDKNLEFVKLNNELTHKHNSLKEFKDIINKINQNFYIKFPQVIENEEAKIKKEKFKTLKIKK